MTDILAVNLQAGDAQDPNRTQAIYIVSYPQTANDAACVQHARHFGELCGPLASLAVERDTDGHLYALISFKSAQSAADALHQSMPAINGCTPRVIPWSQKGMSVLREYTSLALLDWKGSD